MDDYGCLYVLIIYICSCFCTFLMHLYDLYTYVMDDDM